MSGNPILKRMEIPRLFLPVDLAPINDYRVVEQQHAERRNP